MGFAANNIWRFGKEMEVGDILVATHGFKKACGIVL